MEIVSRIRKFLSNDNSQKEKQSSEEDIVLSSIESKLIDLLAIDDSHVWRVFLLSIDNVDNRDLVFVLRLISSIFGCDFFVGKRILEDKNLIITKNNNLDADLLLANVSQMFDDSSLCDNKDIMIFLLADKISIKKTAKTKKEKEILGYASLSKGIAVVSTGSMSNSNMIKHFEQLATVVIHEVCHTFGLNHHEKISCIMNANIASEKLSPIVLCDGCLLELRSSIERKSKNV